METKMFKAAEDGTCDEMAEAGRIIRDGGLVAFPTETVYGLGGDAASAQSSEKIYAAKGRPSDNPLIVHIAEFSQLEEIASSVPEAAGKLNDAFWPGPLTMIVNKNDVIPYETTGGLDTVAVRMPSHPVARALIKESGCMIAAPSANTSGRPSPTCAQHVWEDLNGKIDGIIDGGSVDIGLESTIIDLTEDVPTILRPGYITQDMLTEVLGEVRLDPGLQGENTNVRPKAPGMRYKHYAPKGNLKIVTGEEEAVIAKITALAKEAKDSGYSVGILAAEETKDAYNIDGVDVVTIGARDDEDSIARHLFGVLRRFDADQIQVIFSEDFNTPRIGMAIMNRLLKAAAHQVIEA